MKFPFYLAVAGLAAAHFVLGLLTTLFAGLSNHPLLLALAKILIFPSEQFPASIQNKGALIYVLYAATCFLIWLAIAGSVRMIFSIWGLKAATVWCGLLLVGFSVLLFSCANPAPDWSSQAHRYLRDHYFFLPEPILESADARTKAYAIHENLNPGQPFVPPATGRWYWKYRSTMSGHPAYQATVVASLVKDVPDREAFLKEVEAQDAQGWKTRGWQKLKESDRWILETIIPDMTPIAPSEKNRLIRVVAKQPSRGVWIGLMALQQKMDPGTAVSIVERAMDSVSPMSEDEHAAASVGQSATKPVE